MHRLSVHSDPPLYAAGLDTLKRKDGGALARAISAASRAAIPISTVSKHELNELVDNRPHQVQQPWAMAATLCIMSTQALHAHPKPGHAHGSPGLRKCTVWH